MESKRERERERGCHTLDNTFSLLISLSDLCRHGVCNYREHVAQIESETSSSHQRVVVDVCARDLYDLTRRDEMRLSGEGAAVCSVL